MNSLTSKRNHAYRQKQNLQNLTLDIDKIETNTDEVENKLSSVITNTENLLYSGIVNFTHAASETLSTPSIDITSSSKIFNFQWIGTTDSSHLEFTIHASNNGVDFFPIPSALFLKTGSNLECSYPMPFRYHKLTVVNTHASTASTSLQYAARN